MLYHKWNWMKIDHNIDINRMEWNKIAIKPNSLVFSINIFHYRKKMPETSGNVRWVLQYNIKIQINNSNNNWKSTHFDGQKECDKRNHEFLLLAHHITFKFERSSVDLCWKVAKIVINEKYFGGLSAPRYSEFIFCVEKDYIFLQR